jgi:HEAT repeat protein
VKLETAVALGRYGKLAKVGVAPLSAALADKDLKVKEEAAMALGRIGADAKIATDELLSLLKEADSSVRKAAVFALGRVEPDDVVKPSQALVPLVSNEKDAELRKEAVSTLGLLGDKSQDTVKAVARALGDQGVEVRRQAAQSLAKFFTGAKAADKELLSAFKMDADPLVRAYSLHTVCFAYGEDAHILIPELASRLDPQLETDADVRIAICDELGTMGPSAQSAVPALRTAQKDPETKVRTAATAALKRTTTITAPKVDK